MDNDINQFLKEHKVATICCVDEDGRPYCFNCFVAYNDRDCLLYFKSSPRSRHSQLLLQNRHMAGTLLPDTVVPLAAKGAQFTGVVLERTNSLSRKAAQFYYKKFPLALAVPGDIWAVQLLQVKLTENRSGVKKNSSWQRSTEVGKGVV